MNISYCTPHGWYNNIGCDSFYNFENKNTYYNILFDVTSNIVDEIIEFNFNVYEPVEPTVVAFGPKKTTTSTFKIA